ncbi:MAG: DNA mismatch repair endonuclease MutL [Thermoanaerobaculia bacterium]
MPKIRALDSRTIDRIAAGEVVERPASLAKELIENSLDAGATSIEIDLTEGGIGSLRVRDDGCGMSREDALLSLERHATSKIRTEEDLVGVSSFGFRGEALPSIASVSRFTLTTSDGSGPGGTRLHLDFGGPRREEPAARPRGTDVLVEDLFRKTPARRKFLKTPEGEAREISRVATRLALAHPGVRFALRSEGREVFDLARAAGWAERGVQLFGREALGDLLPFEARSGPLRLSGLATRGSITFASRRLQFLFVNSRAVEDRGVSRAIQQAAKEAIRTDRHPGVFLFLTAPEGTVDVNVSPAKTEVRFAQPSEVYRLVFHGVLSALTAGKEERRLVPVPSADFSVAEATELYAAGPERPPSERRVRQEAAGPASSGVQVRIAEADPIRAIGQYDESFLLAEGSNGLLVLDQHAAHERVLYEKFRDRIRKGRAFSQALLTGAVFEASPEEASTLEESRELLAAAGFEIEAMSGRSWAIAGVPSEASGRDPAAFLRDILAEILNGSREIEMRRDRIAATVACRSAVTIHHRLALPEIERLLADWVKCEDRFTCPHGRPVVLSVSDSDLLAFFKRK